ncbi:MAG TPA: hypothetical protein VJ891_17215, partial [Casimicrobiaceae bacterium]|nr:hypothetical protein [Casimicrobiaceae bacterium]
DLVRERDRAKAQAQAGTWIKSSRAPAAPRQQVVDRAAVPGPPPPAPPPPSTRLHKDLSNTAERHIRRMAAAIEEDRNRKKSKKP